MIHGIVMLTKGKRGSGIGRAEMARDQQTWDLESLSWFFIKYLLHLEKREGMLGTEPSRAEPRRRRDIKNAEVPRNRIKRLNTRIFSTSRCFSLFPEIG